MKKFFMNMNSLSSRSLIYTGVCVGIVVAGWYGYRWWRASQDQQAYAEFEQTYDHYYRVLASAKSAHDWQDVEKAFEFGADRHKWSSLYPYFVALHADVLVHEGRLADALQSMDTLMKKLPKSAQLYPYFARKRALMKLDTHDERLEQEGLQELEYLSRSDDAQTQDMALYDLGYHAWTSGKQEQAEGYWKTLLQKDSKQSVWKQKAKRILQAKV